MDFFYNKDFFNGVNNIYQGAISAGKMAVRGFFTSIYTLIAVPACYVVYKLYQVLEANGVIDSFKDTLTYQLSVVEYIANNCFVLILHMGDFASCVVNATPS